jgi:DNA-binding HxlR family transcriptional regulator
MRTYGQFCPVAKAAEIFCERWTALIIRDLACGASRFSELKRGVPLMSPTLLARRLRQLEQEGVVECRRTGRMPTYHLTPAGEELVPAVDLLSNWGQRWTRRTLAEGEIDLGLLLWGMERRVCADALGRGRTVVLLTFVDQPAAKRNWWFVNENGRVHVCVKDPGFDVDLYLAATLPDMIYIWRGDLALSKAQATGLLKVHGFARARGALRAWLNLGEWTKVRSQRRCAA